ncbi:hypothetical protein K469DRAFT_717772 [Zopfia rhizophila CBS 207.26]|uniref:Pullulan synthetase n=1 Tax=Zopfia rhizophila CBS 207.26 TaxID=1314779 RepID=A0A6A6DIN1_9PEZI|nr:hypothetical protein K469DRAFT_717772 [Zopfia rhizophila CBS 207.26]
MRFQTLTILTFLSTSVTTALPTELKDFLLVTTDQAEPSINSSNLRAVSATSLFDPYKQPALLLRLIGPGYNSLPTFNLNSGTLQTISTGPTGTDEYLYNSTKVQSCQELQFLASEQPAGNLGLDQGYLLAVDGEREGWTICLGKLDQDVLYWKGTDTSCNKTFIHAVTKAPY